MPRTKPWKERRNPPIKILPLTPMEAFRLNQRWPGFMNTTRLSRYRRPVGPRFRRVASKSEALNHFRHMAIQRFLKDYIDGNIDLFVKAEVK